MWKLQPVSVDYVRTFLLSSYSKYLDLAQGRFVDYYF